jgi:hypothetical protein
MKKQYIEPVTDIVKVRLVGSLLESIGVNEGSIEGDPGDSFGKENGEFEEESLINPTQPNLWDDNEEE